MQKKTLTIGTSLSYETQAVKPPEGAMVTSESSYEFGATLPAAEPEEDDGG